MVDRLAEYGELSPAQARALRKVVSQRMMRAATPRSRNDRVRLAMLQAMHEKRPAKERRVRHGEEAEVRRRLRTGLDVWALERLFVPRPASMTTCSNHFQLSQNLCDALLAASGGISLAGARVLGDEREGRRSYRPNQALMNAKALPDTPDTKAVKREQLALAASPARPVKWTASQPAFDFKPASDLERASDPKRPSVATSTSTFAQAQASKPASDPKPVPATKAAVATAVTSATPAQHVRPASAQKVEEKPKLDRPNAAPVAESRAVPETAADTEPESEPPSPASLRRKAEYERERQAYWERKRQEVEARKVKIRESEGAERVQRGPATPLEAEVTGLAPKSADAIASTNTPPSKAATGAKTAAKTARSSPKTATAQPAPTGADAANSRNPNDLALQDDNVDDLVGDLLQHPPQKPRSASNGP